MIEVLVEKLGPPSLTEEVMGKIRSTEASEYAGEAVGMMTVFISPATAVSRGVRYLGKFMSMVKDCRKQEVKDVYQEWTDRVKRGYSEEKLKRFFDESPDFNSGLVEAVASFKPVLIILETRGTLYDLFLPLIIQHLVEEIGFIPPHRRPRKQEDDKKKGKKEEEWESDKAYFLIQRQFEMPDDGSCYVQTHKEDARGHFKIRQAKLSRNRLQIRLPQKSEAEWNITFAIDVVGLAG